MVSAWHGGAHNDLMVELSPAQNLFVYVVVLLAPLVAASLTWTRYSVAGVWLFTGSMIASLIFGVYYHYVLVSPDNVGHLPAADAAIQFRFALSAACLAVVESVSAIAGVFFCRSQLRGHRA